MARRRKPSRRRANQDRSRHTVEAILEASSQVLLREGYARTTTNRIALRAGVSVGSVYQYFRDKDDVLAALTRRQTQALVDAITRTEPDPGRPLREVLEELLRVALRFGPQGPELFRRLEQVPHAGLHEAVAEGRAELTRFVRDLLDGYRAQLRVTDLDLAAYLIVSTAEGAGLHAAPEVFDERLAGELSTLFARYLLEAP